MILPHLTVVVTADRGRFFARGICQDDTLVRIETPYINLFKLIEAIHEKYSRTFSLHIHIPEHIRKEAS